MKVVFGCPVVDRAWILPEWLAAIDAQGLDDYEIACLVGPCTDHTERILLDHPKVRVWRSTERRSHEDIVAHSWNPAGLQLIASARNALRLRVLAAYEFDYYFSLDSDVILEPRATKQLVEWLRQGFAYPTTEPTKPFRLIDAVSPLVKMTPDADFTNLAWNYMTWIDQHETASRPGRQPAPSSAQVVDVLMAAILMRREILEESHWAPHPQGEDVAWSRLARHHGWTLMLDPSVRGDHRMYHPELM